MAGGVNIYGQLVRAQLEILSADPTPGVTGRVYWNSTTSKPRIDTGSACVSLSTALANANTIRGNNTGSAADVIDLTVAQVITMLGLGSVPSGAIMPWAGTATPPTAYLICDGSAVSRTTYSVLFGVIGIAHGQGDGSTTFNLPDYRGRFLRGVDEGAGNDPDTLSRTAMNTGGNTGDSVGSLQADNYASHTHTQNSHTHGSPGSDWVYYVSTGGSGTISAGTAFANASNVSASTTAVNQNSGGNETRPKNAYVYWIIKT